MGQFTLIGTKKYFTYFAAIVIVIYNLFIVADSIL